MEIYPDLLIYNFPQSLERIIRHMSVSPEMMTKVAQWRDKARQGTLTQEEMREAISFLRQERMAMPPPSSRTAKPQVNGDDLLKELGLGF